jgi:molecular chaperone DnaK
VPADVRDEVTAAVADVKAALEADDVDAITRTGEALATVSQKMGQAMYAAGAADAGTASAGEAGGDTTTGDDEVVDAEIVDEAPDTDGGAA